MEKLQLAGPWSEWLRERGKSHKI